MTAETQKRENERIDLQAVHGFVSSRIKDMYGKGARRVSVKVSGQDLEIQVQFTLNHIEKQLMECPSGTELVEETRRTIFEDKLDENIRALSTIIRKPIGFSSIHWDMSACETRAYFTVGA